MYLLSNYDEEFRTSCLQGWQVYSYKHWDMFKYKHLGYSLWVRHLNGIICVFAKP